MIITYFRVFYLFGLMMIIASCTAVSNDSAQPMGQKTAALSASPSYESFLGFQGLWLRTESMCIFVGVEPAFRLLGFRRADQVSLWAEPPVAESGLRLAYMEPEQKPGSFHPGQQPARIISFSDRRALVELAPSSVTKTQYTVHVELDRDRSSIHLQFRLKNLDQTTRRFAAWSVIALPSVGQIIVPYGQTLHDRRRMVLPPWSTQPQANLTMGHHALAMDLDHDMTGSAFKLGLDTDAGWAGYRLGRQVLLSCSAYDPNAEYPEGDANVTIFQMNADAKDWAEIEHVSPLTEVPPAGEVVLNQTVWLLEIPVSDPLGPDALREAIHRAWPGNP